LIPQQKSDTKEALSEKLCDASQQFSVASATASRENREFSPEREPTKHAPSRARLFVLLSKALRGASREGALSPRLFAVC